MNLAEYTRFQHAMTQLDTAIDIIVDEDRSEFIEGLRIVAERLHTVLEDARFDVDVTEPAPPLEDDGMVDEGLLEDCPPTPRNDGSPVN